MSSKEQTLLTLLSDGKFHSGEILSCQLKMNRSEIWEHINSLEKKGLAIEYVSEKGYKIPNGLTLLRVNSIRQNLNENTKRKISSIECLNQIHSTNTYLIEKASRQNPKTIACFTEQQSRGKGRRGLKWLSPYANNIYCSILYYFDKSPSEILGLSLAAGVLTVQALYDFKLDALRLKWPNDILWNNKKLGGILVEIANRSDKSCAAVIGIGINTRITIQESLNQPIASTEEILQQPTDRNYLAGILLNRFIPGLEQFEKDGLKSFMNTWRNLDSYSGEVVRLTSPQKEIIGIMKGISEDGELLLEDKQGRITKHFSGAISLRKVEKVI